MIPADADFIHLHQYYKVGRFNKVFIWMIDEWRASALTHERIAEITRARKARVNRWRGKLKVQTND